MDPSQVPPPSRPPRERDEDVRRWPRTDERSRERNRERRREPLTEDEDIVEEYTRHTVYQHAPRRAPDEYRRRRVNAPLSDISEDTESGYTSTESEGHDGQHHGLHTHQGRLGRHQDGYGNRNQGWRDELRPNHGSRHVPRNHMIPLAADPRFNNMHYGAREDIPQVRQPYDPYSNTGMPHQASNAFFYPPPQHGTGFPQPVGDMPQFVYPPPQQMPGHPQQVPYMPTHQRPTHYVPGYGQPTRQMEPYLGPSQQFPSHSARINHAGRSNDYSAPSRPPPEKSIRPRTNTRPINEEVKSRERAEKHRIELERKLDEALKGRAEAEAKLEKRNRDKEKEAAELAHQLDIERDRIKSELSTKFEEDLKTERLVWLARAAATVPRDKLDGLQTQLSRLNEYLAMEADKNKRAERRRKRLWDEIRDRSLLVPVVDHSASHAELEETDSHDSVDDGETEKGIAEELEEIQPAKQRQAEGVDKVVNMHHSYPPPELHPGRSPSWLPALPTVPPAVPNAPISNSESLEESRSSDDDSESDSSGIIPRSEWPALSRQKHSRRRERKEERDRQKLRMFREESIDLILKFMSAQEWNTMFRGVPAFMHPAQAPFTAPKPKEESLSEGSHTEKPREHHQSVIPRGKGQIKHRPRRFGVTKDCAQSGKAASISSRGKPLVPIPGKLEDEEDSGVQLTQNEEVQDEASPGSLLLPGDLQQRRDDDDEVTRIGSEITNESSSLSGDRLRTKSSSTCSRTRACRQHSKIPLPTRRHDRPASGG